MPHFSFDSTSIKATVATLVLAGLLVACFFAIGALLVTSHDNSKQNNHQQQNSLDGRLNSSSIEQSRDSDRERN